MRQRTHNLISRLMALLLAALMLLPCLPTAWAAEGACGAGLSWSLEGGTLTITGSGDMADFADGVMAPWHDQRHEITRILLPQGLTSVGQLAFFECDRVETVVLPESVTRIGDYAFTRCTALRFIDLGSAVTAIGRSAFEGCAGLTSIRLPEGLNTIGFQAFYRCAGLTAITVPASVTELGMSAFAYCTSLVSADVRAQISRVPEWLFFDCPALTVVTLSESITGVDKFGFQGCESLYHISYYGTSGNAEQIRQDVEGDGGGRNVGVDALGGGEARVEQTVDTGSGLRTETTTGTQSDNASVGAVIVQTQPSSGGSSVSAQVNATVEQPGGWDEVVEEVKDVIQHTDLLDKQGSNTDPVNVTVYLSDGVELTDEVLKQFAGQNMTLTVYVPSGDHWTLDCTQLSARTLTVDALDLSYVCLPAGEEVAAELGATAAYLLTFNSDAEINAEVVIQLPVAHARQTATLYQRAGKEPERLQASLVDDRGNAHFYLANVDAETEYIIAINVPGESAESAIVPSTMTQQMGVEQFSKTEYVITGRTSSWGLNFSQVTWILVGVMVGAVVIVGVVMFVLNKRKLKRGYVPEYDEDEE